MVDSQCSVAVRAPHFTKKEVIVYTSHRFHSIGVIKTSNFPLNPTGPFLIDVSKWPSILLYEVLTHATRYTRRVGIRNPHTHTSSCKWSGDLISFSFPSDLQTRGGLAPAIIRQAVPSVDSLSPVPDDLLLWPFPGRSLGGFVIHHYVSLESMRCQPDPFLYAAAQRAPGQPTVYPIS